MQLIVNGEGFEEGEVMVIECNLRASRSFPFSSKCLGVNFIELATQAMCGKEEVPAFGRTAPENDFVGAKAPMFSFQRLKGADPSLGVEMASTGEVACMGPNKYDAFLKSLMSTGMKLPRQNILVSIQDRERNEGTLKSLKTFSDLGYKLFATEKTAAFLESNDVPVTQLDYPTASDDEDDEAVRSEFCIDDYISRGEIHLVLMFSNQYSQRTLSNYAIRRLAVDYNVPLITNVQVAQMFAESLQQAGARATGDKANDKVLGDSRSLAAWYE